MFREAQRVLVYFATIYRYSGQITRAGAIMDGFVANESFIVVKPER
jgi:hypothetical protein